MNEVDRRKMIREYQKLFNQIKREAEANWTPPSSYKDNKPQLKDFELENINIDKLLEFYEAFKKEESKGNLYEKMLSFLLTYGLFAFALFGWLSVEISFSLIIIYLLMTYIAYLKRKIYKFEYETEYQNYQKYKTALKDYEWWQLRKKKDFWTNLNGRQFEIEICKLFNKNGYETKICKQGGDGGTDIELCKNGNHSIAQCKAHKSKISPSVARDLYGTMTSKNIKQGYLVTLYGGTAGAIEFCRNNNIILWDLSDILKLM